MAEPQPDVIDTLVGIAPGSALDRVRARRPVARAQSQESWRVLFAPDDPGDVPLVERLALGACVTGLHGEARAAEDYAARLRDHAPPALAEAVAGAIAQTRTRGPYGRFPPGPPSAEDAAGPGFRVEPATARALGPRLTAAFAHAHFLVLHPRDAAPEAFRPLLDAGWSTTGIVTLSQIVAFLSYQVRVVAGLRALAAAAPPRA
jgi:CMD domain protein